MKYIAIVIGMLSGLNILMFFYLIDIKFELNHQAKNEEDHHWLYKRVDEWIKQGYPRITIGNESKDYYYIRSMLERKGYHEIDNDYEYTTYQKIK